MYATKRRRRTVKSQKPSSKDPPKSNPSKRHRERLNSELDRIASLLPFEQSVISKLDKLSILRLSVSFLRTKTYFQAILSSQYGLENHHVGRTHLFQDPTFSEGESILQALYGFIFVVSHDGEVFFASRTVEQYLGFHQSDIIHQSVMELIHSEDRDEFKRQLLWNAGLPQEKSDMNFSTIMLPVKCMRQPQSFTHVFDTDPENGQYLYRSFTVRFRCLLDNTSGFITLEINGWIRMLHGQNIKVDEPQFALFATCCPFGPMSLLDLPSRDLTFRSKHKMDLSPISMDNRGRLLFGYSDRDLSLKSGYDLIHPDDLAYFAAAHEELIKTGSSGLIAYRWQASDLQWVWLQSSCRVVYKNSKPDFVISTHRQLTTDEGEDLCVKRGTEFKLPYPLLDIDICSGFGFTEDDLTTKSKSPKNKKSKNQSANKDIAQLSKDYASPQGAPQRKKRCLYKDSGHASGSDMYPGFNAYTGSDEMKPDYIYSYPGPSYSLEPDLYRTAYPIIPGTAVYTGTPEAYKIETDRHGYSNGYYFDHRQYQHQMSYHGNGYPDFMTAKYYEYPKYGIDGYTIDLKKKVQFDDDYLTHFDSLRKYSYDYATNSRVNGPLDGLSFRSCHNYGDGYGPVIDSSTHEALRDSNRNLHPSLSLDSFTGIVPQKQFPSSSSSSSSYHQDSVLKQPSVTLNYPMPVTNACCESEPLTNCRSSQTSRNYPVVPWTSCVRTSQDVPLTSPVLSPQPAGLKDREEVMGSVAISVIQPTDKLHNRPCEDVMVKPTTWPPVSDDYIKPWLDDFNIQSKHAHSAVAVDTYLTNNSAKFRLGFNVM